MAEFNKEEFANKLIKMAEEFDPHDYRANAFREIEEVEALGKRVPHIAFIVNDYPEFNHIELKCTQPDVFVFKICVNPAVIRENHQFAYELAEMYAFWASQGGHEE
jgi:hypothetical protein